jgi:hypothetical protein
MSTIDSLLDIITVSSSTEMDQRKLDFTLTWLLSALLNKSVFQQVMLVCIKFRFVCCPQMADCRWSLSIKRWDSVGEFQSVGRINQKPTRIRSKLGAGCCSVCRIAWLVGRKSLKIEFANSIGPFVKVFTGIGQKMELKNRILNLL